MKKWSILFMSYIYIMGAEEGFVTCLIQVTSVNGLLVRSIPVINCPYPLWAEVTGPRSPGSQLSA